MAASKKEVAIEIFENMPDITKEQYLAFCELYDELGLEREEKEPDWEAIFAQIQ